MGQAVLEQVVAVARLSPAVFAAPDEGAARECAAAAKALYDSQGSVADAPTTVNDVTELDVGFDTEQLWEELQLRNKPLASFLAERTAAIEATVPEEAEHDEDAVRDDAVQGDGDGDGDAEFDEEGDHEDDGEDEEDEEGGADDDDAEEEGLAEDDGQEDDAANNLENREDDMDDAEAEDVAGRRKNKAGRRVSFAANEDTDPGSEVKKSRAAELEDDFLKLEEMEEYLELSEKLDEEGKIFPDGVEGDEGDEGDEDDKDDEDDEDDEGIDDLGDDVDEDAEGEDLDGEEEDDAEDDAGDDERAREIRYADFFARRSADDSASTQKRKLLDAEDDDEDVLDDEVETPLMARRKRMRGNIERLEAEAVAEKHWTMKGEVTADDRPANSLLEATVDYNVATKPAPVVTEEATEELEEMIKRRIVDGIFDDVVRRAPRVEKKKRKAEPLSQEKPKEGLAEVYEKEYLAATSSREGDGGAPKEEARDPRHVEIDVLFKKLVGKLDALSALHYKPKVSVPETPQPRENLPAVAMEDAVPDMTSDATTLAPREVYTAPKRSVGELEKTKEERKAARRAKKTRFKAKKERKEASIRAAEAADPLVKARKEEKLAAASAAKLKRKNRHKRDKMTKSKDFFSAILTATKGQISSVKGGGQAGANDVQDPARSAARLKL